MASIGWIKLHRGINEWGWKSDPNVMALWVHLLTNANFDDTYFLGVMINKGSLATGLISLAEKTGLTVSQVRTALNKLKMTGEIAIKTGNKFSIISIVKWEEYQSDSTQDSKPIANQSQTDSKRIATSKEAKKLRTKEAKNKDSFAPELFSENQPPKKEDSPPSAPEPKKEKSYWYKGLVIRLVKKDYLKFMEMFSGSTTMYGPNFDKFEAYLKKQDAWFYTKPMDMQSRWFHILRNDILRVEKYRNGELENVGEVSSAVS